MFQRADDCPWWIKGDVPDFVKIQTYDDVLRTMRRMVELGATFLMPDPFADSQVGEKRRRRI